MANSDKNIIITPFVNGVTQPNILFRGQGNDPITLRVLDGTTGTGLTAGGAISFEGSAGQLFSVVNRLGTGSIFSVNDISGIPSIDVDANGTIELAPFTGYVGIGLTAPTEKLHVLGNLRVSGNYIGNVVRTVNGITANVGLSAGTNITISQSGNTLTISSTGGGGTGAVSSVTGSGSGISVSPTTGAVVVENTGVHSFNGLTGTVTGVTTGTANIFGPVQQFTTGISTPGITLGTTRLVQGLLRAPGGYAVRSATSSSGVNYNEIELPTIASNTTVSSASGIVNIDAGLNSKVVDYSTGIRFLGYNSGLGFGTSSTIVSGGGVGNTLTLPINTGTLALTNSVVTAFNGLTGSVTGVTTGTANTFGPLQSFTNGISAAGGTLSGTQRFLNGATFNALANFIGGICSSGGTFSGTQTFVNGATFNALANFIGGICSSGGTFSGTQTFVNGATFNALANFIGGICSSGGTFSGTQTFVNGATFNDRVVITSGFTNASPFIITASSLLDGVGAFRINGSEPDLNLNDTDGGFNTISFENAGSVRTAIGRNSSNEFYIAVRDPAVGGGAFKDNVIVANSSTGNVSMGYQLSVAGGLTASGNIFLHGAQIGSTAGTAPKFFSRAFVNFIVAAGVPSIRDSGNVSSITDNGVGYFTVNFVTAMGNTSYCAVFGVQGVTTTADFPIGFIRQSPAPTTGALAITTARTFFNAVAPAPADVSTVNVAIFD